jgi:hypothetical protein
MANNLDKKVNRDARKAANTVFNICGAIVGLAFGSKASSRKSRPSIRRKRPKRW